MIKEAKAATQIKDILNKVDLDLDLVGAEFAKSSSTLFVNRLVIVAENAYETKKGIAREHIGLHQN